MPTVLPQGFIHSLINLPGFDKEAFLDVHERRQPVTSIRINPQKPSRAIENLPVESQVPWCASGRYLSERPSFTLDPVFHGGAYYVQEASSMFLDHVVKGLYKHTRAPSRVLDLCAAPGGKSTLLASALPDSFIVSNEVIKTRVSMLSENISKWGNDNVVVTNNDPKDFKRLPGFFDLIVIDAPCSGSGLFRKDPGAVNEWSEDNVEMCSMRQQRILNDAISALNENGYLVYSTCSYSTKEDEDICDYIIEQFQLEPIQIPVDPSWGIITTVSKKAGAFGYRFYPDKVAGEGFFIACFKQPDAVATLHLKTERNIPVSKKIQSMVEPFLKNPSDYVLGDQKEIVIGSPKKWEEEIAVVTKNLYVRKSGVAIGTIKGKDVIPHHELALSHLIALDIARVILNKEEALQYLKRHDIALDTSATGWTLCIHGDIKIGWIKVLPNRVNNYYPTNWRILKA